MSIGPDGEVFKMLARLYPLADSRIDWRKLELRVQGGSGDEPDWTSRFVSFFREQRDVHGLSGRVIYAGDGVTTLAVQADMDDMIEIMPIVLSSRSTIISSASATAGAFA
ncbi:hypothetical protein [Chenggangzhangella methanolivorans]|uniref:Uncharacterized protein n=1 Tax=Chenggangzhangella methanolivorans TaxID=1437009 RepID=A0A9E6UQF8_9HYPH|nr:hypothetical protein [Chenggangzhangella methanolivorans]QZO00890.1 hypothetical protein K6K41_04415 [Chenggangzhangella methanolivorans]